MLAVMLATLMQVTDPHPSLDPAFLLDVSYLTPLVGLFIPILVGLLAKSSASSQVKAFLNMGLSALSGFVTAVIANSGAFTLKEAVNGIVIAWIASWAAYNGFLKPAGVTDAVQRLTSSVGVGGKSYGIEFSDSADAHGVDGELLALHEDLERLGTTPREFAEEMKQERS